MPIPALSPEGYLPAGVHDCTLDELRLRFGQFQGSDRRPRLFERLQRFVREARATGLIAAIIVDGSFVTAKDSPNDIDLIIVLRAGHDFNASLRPFEYNAISRQQIRRLFRFDALMAQENSIVLTEHVSFFSQVRRQPGQRKGMLRIQL
jgi:hypothetical protein